MKTILIYGDSNTFGESAFSKAPRLSYEERWAGKVAEAVAGKAWVIAEGFSGRTAGDLQTGDKGNANGRQYFATVYGSHKPIDIIIIALGTNDCKHKFSRTAEEIMDDITWYVDEADRLNKKEAHFITPHFLFVAPPPFTEKEGYFKGCNRKRRALIELMKARYGDAVIDAGDVELSEDGVHFSLDGHAHMATAVRSKLESMIKKEEK